MLGSLDFTEAALVEVEVAERFFDSADFVEWLVTKFWKKLKLRLHQLAVDEESHVICIMVITALEGFPNPTPSSELYCRSESIEIHDLERIICLPLTRWSSDEIDQWLGGLSFVNDHKTRAEIKREAERLYRLSNHGIPTHVCARLDDFFSKLSASPTT